MARILAGCGAVAERPIAIAVSEVHSRRLRETGRACPYPSAGSNPVGTAADPATWFSAGRATRVQAHRSGAGLRTRERRSRRVFAVGAAARRRAGARVADLFRPP